MCGAKTKAMISFSGTTNLVVGFLMWQLNFKFTIYCFL